MSEGEIYVEKLFWAKNGALFNHHNTILFNPLIINFKKQTVNCRLIFYKNFKSINQLIKARPDTSNENIHFTFNWVSSPHNMT
jgi:hypothetical protein